ncbi:putative serine/threonine-protein kinase nek2 [Cucumis melo var. makuwa]|uniref:Serine/threonine-protein kinase nek2 n=1 Tax=Cucumis melo var. makuwa TaxID=1194695 RepID=A0A5A7UMW6_CUCMM|nr:putative serine/threonine-protein kinase nek2 [Cucumis melo var. makuwa]
MDDLNEEVGVGELNATVEEIDTRNEIPKELKRRRGPTIMFDLTRIRSLRDKKVVRYNEDGAPIELKDKIFTTVEAAFVIDPRSRENVLQTAGISFRQFKNWLTTKYIMPHKDAPQLLQVPPEKYSFIEQNHWEEFVRSRLSETFQDEISMNTDSSSVNRHCSNDVLTQALCTKEHNGRVHGVGGYVIPTTYFHSVKKTLKDEVNILVENEELRRRVSELEAQIRSNLSTPLSAHGSCSRPIMDLIKMPTEKEIVCESTSTLPLALKSILRYAEKVMEKDSSITFSLPADLFGISRKSSVLREDIIDLCNMNEVKTFTLVAYMMGHWTLLAINAYEDTVFYLDSLRTTSKATTRYVTNTAIAIFHSQKNINKSRKQTLWRTCPLQVGSTTCEYYVMKYMREIVNRGSIVISDSIDTQKSYSQAELDEVRVELVEFLGSYI